MVVSSTGVRSVADGNTLAECRRGLADALDAGLEQRIGQLQETRAEVARRLAP